jgi:hypothetical protein
MKKTLYLLLVTVTLFSCVKREYNPDDMQEVTFTAAEISPDVLLKSTTDYNCQANLTPDYAKIVIAGFAEPFYPQVFHLDGNLYTQSIKLAPGTYTVEQFLVMDDMGTPGELNGDQIYMAIPEAGSDFAVYTSPAVPFTFTVDAFVKKEIPVEILCFQPQFYTLFGFDWFALTEIVIREKCFFGDVCVDPDDYLTSLYDLEQLPAGCQVDMPAIFKVYITRNGDPVPNSPFTNATAAAGYGSGAPLCVQYPDYINITDVFSFEIHVLVYTGPGTFGYQLYHTFQITDDQLILPDGGDGVVDFAIGDCSPYSDFIWPWQIIPPLD